MNSIVDITDLICGETKKFPSISEGNVWIIRTKSGNITMKVDPSVHRKDLAEALRKLAGGDAVDEDLCGLCLAKGARRSCGDSPMGGPAEGPSCPATVSVSEEGAEDGLPSADEPWKGVAEDVIQWKDRYFIYRLGSGNWWWARWACGQENSWGLGGPRYGALEARRGPFDSYDDTFSNMDYLRLQDIEKIKKIGDGGC